MKNEENLDTFSLTSLRKLWLLLLQLSWNSKMLNCITWRLTIPNFISVRQ